MSEAWKDIPGYEGRYQASTAGRIRSVERSVTQVGRWGRTFTRVIPGKVLRPGQYCKAGHVSVVLGKQRGTNKNMPGSPVHTLVMLTFIGPRPKGLDIRHLDGDPKNNRLANLAYGTRSENIKDAINTGKPWRVLTRAQGLEIRARALSGERPCDLAREYGVLATTICNIKYGRTHVS